MEENGLQNLINNVESIGLIINILHHNGLGAMAWWKISLNFKTWFNIFFATFDHAQTWDEHLFKILFGYRCGVQSNIKFSPHMILTSHTPNFALDCKL